MSTPTTRHFEGTVSSASPAFGGLHAPAKLKLIDGGNAYECRFAFDVGTAISFILTVPKNDQNRIEGSASDPRGWDVAFSACLDGDRVTGTFSQPHDHGTFDLREVG